MKTPIIAIALLCPLLASAQMRTIADYNRWISNQAQADIAAAKKAAIDRSNHIAKVKAQNKWLAANPWVADPVWIEATNRIAQENRKIAALQKEHQLLSTTGMANSDRAKTLWDNIGKSQAVLRNLNAVKAKAESNAKLRQFYATQPK